MSVAPWAIWLSGALYLAAAVEFGVRRHWIDAVIWTSYATANVAFGLKALLAR